jgi:hypothetical protein
MFGRHQPQECRQLPDVLNLAPISDTGQKMAGDNPTDPRNTPKILNTAVKLWIVVAESADLSHAFKRLLLGKLQIPQKRIQLKTDRFGAGKLLQLTYHHCRPLTARGGLRKSNSFKQQQRLDPTLIGSHLPDKRIPKLG